MAGHRTIFLTLCTPWRPTLTRLTRTCGTRPSSSLQPGLADAGSAGQTTTSSNSAQNGTKPYRWEPTEPMPLLLHALLHTPLFKTTRSIPFFGAVYPPVNAGAAQPFQHQHLQTQQVVPQPGLRQADYYRPNHGEGSNQSRVGPSPRGTGPASARMIELGSLPEDLSNLLFNSLGSTDDLPKEARTTSQDQGC